MGAWNHTQEMAASLVSLANMSADVAGLKARSFLATHGGSTAANATRAASRLLSPRALLMRLPGAASLASAASVTSAVGTGLLALGDSPALSFANLQDMLHGNMAVKDGVGWVAARLEWWTLWLIAKDERGMLSQERVRAAFDGSLWPQLEEQAIRRRGYDVAPWVAKRPRERDQAPPAVAGKAVIPRGPREGREPTGGEAAK